MERESFDNESIAAILNENFVCIKVDREERPDLDDIYMAASMSISGQGGWPLNVFLTPELKPFFAGTYFPPGDSAGRPGFATLAGHMAEAWKSNREDLLAQANKISSRLIRQLQGQGKVLGLEPELLDQAISELAQRFDPQHGGFSQTPKFPAPANLQLLLRYYARSQDPRVLEMSTKTLDGMANGGIFDHLGGGFSRYSVDERWLVPHFEKMLYDNAQMASVYIEAYQVTQTPLYRKVARQTLDYVLREMTAPEGGFYSSSDADSEGVEGKYFCWTVEEVAKVLGETGAQRFCAYYGVTPGGNWEGKNVLNTPRPLPQVAAQLGVDAEDLERELEASRVKMLEARGQRVAPAIDDKVLTAWNGMMIQALAEGYRVFGEENYLNAARKAADFIHSHLTTSEGRLLRSWRAGKAHLNAYLEDYAFLGEALLTLYEACGEEVYFERAQQLAGMIVEHFASPDGGFFDTSDDHETLLVRHRSQSDGAIPGAQGVAGLLLVRLSYHLGKAEYRARGLEVLTAMGKDIRQFAAGFSRHLLVLDYALAGPLEIAACLPAEPRRHPLMEGLSRHFIPNRTIAWRFEGQSPKHPLVAEKLYTGEAALHLCQSSTCAAPVTQVDDIVKAISTLKQYTRFELHPRLPGKATAEATQKLASQSPEAYRALGNTGLMVSRLGFGGYRIDDETADHEQALLDALDGGVNLIDTSTNYTEGGSERLIGAILRRQPERRESLVVVTKAGYVQGSNLEVAMARQQMGRPYQQLVEYQEGCWHCIHPEFLADQLERASMRLSLQTLDVFLLHNPEYFLMDCQERGRNNLAEVREEFDARIEQAFAYLESCVEEGRIQYYGVSSNTFAGPEDGLTSTSLQRMLDIAAKVGGDSHHFRVVQVPLNILEAAASKTFLELARENNLGVLVNRPLNAFVQQTLVRLAEFETDSDELQLDVHLEALAAIEGEYRQNFGPFVQGQGADQLFRFAENLKSLPVHLQNLEHWTQLESQRIRPSLMEQVHALDQAMNGPIAEAWVQWRDRYMVAFRDVSNDLEEVAIRRSQRLAESVSQLLRPALKDVPEGATLSQLACWVVDGIGGVTTVLVGMRQSAYVEDLLPVLKWPTCQSAQAAIQEMEGWSNPHGVLA